MPSVILIAVGVWFLSSNSSSSTPEDETRPAVVSTPVEGTADFEIVGRQHIAVGTPGSGYNSDPPISGVHWPEPAKLGIYDKPLPDEQLIHNLEHGHIWISYRPANVSLQSSQSSPAANLAPGISEEELKELEEIVKADEWKIIMTPREKNDAKIILAAWGRLLKMDDLNKDKVEAFIKTYRNRGPEKTMND